MYQYTPKWRDAALDEAFASALGLARHSNLVTLLPERVKLNLMLPLFGDGDAQGYFNENAMNTYHARWPPALGIRDFHELVKAFCLVLAAKRRFMTPLRKLNVCIVFSRDVILAFMAQGHSLRFCGSLMRSLVRTMRHNLTVNIVRAPRLPWITRNMTRNLMRLKKDLSALD
jgi:hypothetical protein